MVHLPVADVEVSGILVVLLGLVIGMLAGFFGVGGGFLLTPMLNALLGIPYSVAVGSSLSQMIGLSSSATIRHGCAGNIDYRLGLIMLGAAAAGAEGGAQALEGLKGLGSVSVLGAEIPAITLVMSLIYAILLTGIGWSVGREAMRSARQGTGAEGEPSTRIMAALRRIRLRPLVSLPTSGIEAISLWILLSVGLVTGFLSGLLGVGGGFILMPVLVYVIGCPTIVAIGTDLFQIIFTAGYGAFTHSMKGNVDLLLVGLMLVGCTIGAHIGASLTGRFDATRVRGGFAALAFVGVVVVIGKLVVMIVQGGG